MNILSKSTKSQIIYFYEVLKGVTKENFEPFCILERFNGDRSIVEYYKFDVNNSPYKYHKFEDKFKSTYHEWTSILDSSRVLTESNADKLFSHLINHHRGDNYNIIKFDSYSELTQFWMKNKPDTTKLK